MELKIDRKVFISALEAAIQVCPAKPVIQILKYIRITTKGDRMKIEANDGQTSLRKFVPIQNLGEDGQFLIECASMLALLKKLKDAEVEIRTEGNEVIVTYGRGTYTFSAVPATDFPEMASTPADSVKVTIPSIVLAEAINSGKKFVGTDELRPVLKCVYMRVSEGKLDFCATDTTRLIHDCITVEGIATASDVEWLIEPGLFTPLTLAAGDSESVDIIINDYNVSYRFGNTVIQSTRTQGKFPQFERVIPKNHTIEAEIEYADICDAVERVLLSSDNRLVKIAFSPLGVKMSANDYANGKKAFEDFSPISCNADIELGLHGDRLLQSLKGCNSAYSVHIHMTDSNKPITIHQLGYPSRSIVMMPMAINNG